MTDDQLIKIYDKVTVISERTTRIETMLNTQIAESARLGKLLENHEERISALEERSAQFFGVREFIAWAIAVGLGVMGVMK